MDLRPMETGGNPRDMVVDVRVNDRRTRLEVVQVFEKITVNAIRTLRLLRLSLLNVRGLYILG